MTAKLNSQNGGANLPVCRDDRQAVAHHRYNLFYRDQ